MTILLEERAPGACDICREPIDGIPFGPCYGDQWCMECWFWQEDLVNEGRQMAEALGIYGANIRHACGHVAHYTLRFPLTETARVQLAEADCLECRGVALRATPALPAGATGEGEVGRE